MHDFLKFLLLFGCVPAQLLLSEWLAPADLGSSRDIASGGHGYVAKAFEAARRTLDHLEIFRRSSAAESPTSSATEVVESSYFARGMHPRKDRGGVAFRVGQIVVHKEHGYRGVVCGWDAIGRAPEEWYERMQVSSENRKEPFYSVLVDVSDRAGHQTTYVQQHNLRLAPDPEPVEHDNLNRYFTHLIRTEARYQAAGWLKKLYPKD